MELPDTNENLNYFSKDLTFKLKDILKSQFNVEPSDTEAQEIGRHIVQFVALKGPRQLLFEQEQ